MISNLGGGVAFRPDGPSDPLPARIRLGGALDVLRPTEAREIGIRARADLRQTFTEFDDLDVFAGAEVGYRSIAYLRAGYAASGEGRSGAALGVGVRYQGFGLDVGRSFDDFAGFDGDSPFQVSVSYQPESKAATAERVIEFLRGRRIVRCVRRRSPGRSTSPRTTIASFATSCSRMESDGLIVRQRRGRYALPEQFDLMPGRLQVTRKGDGFVIPDEPGADDVFVPGRQLATAVDGDRVLVRIERRPPGRNPAGRIVRIVERAWEQIAGIYHPKRGYGFVVPQEPDLGTDIFIPGREPPAARPTGTWSSSRSRTGARTSRRPSAGSCRSSVGRARRGVDVLAILIGHQLPLDFPEGVEQEAREGGPPRDPSGGPAGARGPARPHRLHDRPGRRARPRRRRLGAGPGRW